MLLAIAAGLAGCDTPVGTTPAWHAWGNTQITNPDGGGPQVIRSGPPDTTGFSTWR